jgi:O-methyltransferase involved in polyketide biosynthesis
MKRRMPNTCSSKETNDKPPSVLPPEFQKPLPPELRLPAVSLVAHAAEHRRPQGILSDPLADIWFGALSSVYTQIPCPEGELINGIITRSIIIDYAVLGFCTTHDRVVVSDLGCGLSTRFNRLQPGSVETWIHVDLPEVVRARCAMGRMSHRELALQRDLCDLDANEPLTSYKANNLFILEGVLNHLPKEGAAQVMDYLHEGYPDATVIGTVMTARGQEGLQTLTNALGTPFPAWTIESASHLESWLKPARIERTWLLGKISSRLGLIRPVQSDEASGLAFQARL